jgi:diadenosine tetraphosphate (Ap4A) HIT family hydrolase
MHASSLFAIKDEKMLDKFFARMNDARRNKPNVTVMLTGIDACIQTYKHAHTHIHSRPRGKRAVNDGQNWTTGDKQAALI